MMTLISKVTPPDVPAIVASEPKSKEPAAFGKLNYPGLQSAVSRGDYQRALNSLPADSRDLETAHCRAVCLMRLGRFDKAIDVLRPLLIHSGTQETRGDVPVRIRIDFALALFYGGLPAGAVEVIDEIRHESDPSVRQFRDEVKRWVAGLSWWRRLDWKFNRVASKPLPVAPATPVGRFVWEVG